jgi:hypothetical protein
MHNSFFGIVPRGLEPVFFSSVVFVLTKGFFIELPLLLVLVFGDDINSFSASCE